MLSCSIKTGVWYVQVAVEDIIADGRLRLAVTPVFDESQLAAALQVPLLPDNNQHGL